jgi:hypothetical protein
MVKDDMWIKIGSMSFLVGIVIALLIGLISTWTQIIDGYTLFHTENGEIVAWALAIIGIIIGALAVLGKGTITKKETPGFLIAGIALVVMYGVFSELNIGLGLGTLLSNISLSLALFVAPAVGILAIWTIWEMGKDV